MINDCAGRVEMNYKMIRKVQLVLFIFFMLLATINSLPVFAEDTTTGEAREFLERARKFGNEGNIKAALEEFKKATLAKPDYAEAHRGVGMAYVMLKRNDEAIAPLKEAIRLKSDYANAHYLLGLAYNFLQQYNESMVSYEQAVRFNSSNANAHSDLGSVYLKLNRFEEAIASCKEAVRLKPNHAEAYNDLGVAFSNLQRFDEAIDSFKEAIRLKPDFGGAHYGLGFAYLNLQRYEEAVTPYKEAIRLQPDFKSHYSLGVVYGSLKRYDDAIASYKETIRLKLDYAEAHYNLAMAYEAKSKGSLAIKHMKKAKEIFKSKGDMENVSRAGKNLRILFNKYEGKLAYPTEAKSQTEVTRKSPKMDLKEKIQLAKKRQAEINDQFKTLEEMEGLDDSLISPAEKLEAVKKFIRDYPDRNPKLREAQEMLKRIED
jgi:tetratricopeptide (TPR) repeat protein